jgi:Flp pilus assembly protein TadD
MVGNYPDSATTYRKLVEEYPAELDHQTGLGWAMMKMGRRAEARGMFAEVLGVSPDNASAKAGMSAQ